MLAMAMDGDWHPLAQLTREAALHLSTTTEENCCQEQFRFPDTSPDEEEEET